MKKLSFVVVAIAALVLAGCQTSGAAKGEPEEDIGNEWTLDFVRIASASWSDGNSNSKNPPMEVAQSAENPEGGLDFTFTMYNQRLIFGLSPQQIKKVRSASTIDVIIDGESSGSNKFRYHIGDADVGSDWNASDSFDEADFSSIVTKTIKLDKTRRDKVRQFIIQTRGGNTGDAFTPQTVTIRSVTFICK